MSAQQQPFNNRPSSTFPLASTATRTLANSASAATASVISSPSSDLPPIDTAAAVHGEPSVLAAIAIVSAILLVTLLVAIRTVVRKRRLRRMPSEEKTVFKKHKLTDILPPVHSEFMSTKAVETMDRQSMMIPHFCSLKRPSRYEAPSNAAREEKLDLIIEKGERFSFEGSEQRPSIEQMSVIDRTLWQSKENGALINNSLMADQVGGQTSASVDSNESRIGRIRRHGMFWSEKKRHSYSNVSHESGSARESFVDGQANMPASSDVCLSQVENIGNHPAVDLSSPGKPADHVASDNEPSNECQQATKVGKDSTLEAFLATKSLERPKESFPTNRIPLVSSKKYRAIQAHIPGRYDELIVSIGDAMVVLQKFNDGWAFGHNMTTNQIGAFPLNCIVSL